MNTTNLELLNKVVQIRSIPVCHHGDQLKQGIKGIEEWDKEFHHFLILSVIASSYGPGRRETQSVIIVSIGNGKYWQL